MPDSKGDFWVSLNDYCLKGVTRYNGKKWTDYITSDKFSEEWIGNSIYSIIERKNGNILFSAGSSIIQFDGINRDIFLTLSNEPDKLIVSYGLFEESKVNI